MRTIVRATINGTPIETIVLQGFPMDHVLKLLEIFHREYPAALFSVQVQQPRGEGQGKGLCKG